MARLVAPRVMARVLVLATLAAASGCRRDHAGGVATRPALPTAGVLARVGAATITVADLQAEIGRRPAGDRIGYASKDGRREILEFLIRKELLAEEARQLGYDRDPQVQQEDKREMIARFFAREFDAKLKLEDITEEQVQTYYREHTAEFNRPEQLRVTQIVVADANLAAQITAQARSAPHDDPRPFHELLMKYSRDELSKSRAGHLEFFDRSSTLYPRALIDAAFKLSNLGDVSDPVETPAGFHVLRLTQRRPPSTHDLGQVRAIIQARLFQELRARRLDELMHALHEKHGARIFADTSEHRPDAGERRWAEARSGATAP
jgi:peptidyl-prolyl cis-trans isomerase C